MLMYDRGVYPNGQGQVKCLYCGHLGVRGGGEVWCGVTKGRVYGIGLLIHCDKFLWVGRGRDAENDWRGELGGGRMGVMEV